MKKLYVIAFLFYAILIVGFYSVFLYAPVEKVQGVVQKIFYIHVPSAWVSYLAFFVVFISSIMFLIKSTPFWDSLAYCSAEIGVIFNTMVLITGPFWGKPIWGTWWSWDPRLTTTLILWLIYLTYLTLRAYGGPGSSRYAAVLGVVGFLDVPLIHVSVKWWRSLHPAPVVINPQGPQLERSMLITLLIMLIAFTVLYLIILSIRFAISELEGKIYELKITSEQFKSGDR